MGCPEPGCVWPFEHSEVLHHCYGSPESERPPSGSLVFPRLEEQFDAAKSAKGFRARGRELAEMPRCRRCRTLTSPTWLDGAGSCPGCRTKRGSGHESAGCPCEACDFDGLESIDLLG